MSEIVFFLEEISAKEMLEGLLPKLLPPEIGYRCIVFEGKQDLEGQLVRRMRGYRVPNAKFVILRDKDSGDCHIIKQRLVKKCTEAGHPESLVRIACHELESWYLADLKAVERGLKKKGLCRFQEKNHFKFPDDYPSPSKTLKKISPNYQKVSGSRAIGPYLNLKNKRSPSFFNFVSGIRRII